MLKSGKSRNSKEQDSFFDRVYQVACAIPVGRVSTYGAIARAIGSPGAARMVGWATNNCHSHATHVPAHRVVNRNGLLSGKHHFRHPTLMQELLESEGVKVTDDRVVEFSNLFWDPCDNLI